jgi:superfamily II DNA or RNA helicase
MNLTLRDYQVEDVSKIQSELEDVSSTLYVAATGLGKTVVMAELVRQMLPKRTIFLCHRSELIFQARETFLKAGLECQIEKGELTASTNLFTRSPVVLATVQTMLSGEVDKKRMARFHPMDFGLLIYDESHHSVSKGNKSIVKYFTDGNPNLKVMGATATPSRVDEEALGHIFETVASNRDILFGIENGWLVEPLQQMVHVESIDLTHVHTTAGDLNTGALSAVMEAEEPVQRVAMPTIEAMYELPIGTLNGYPIERWKEVCEFTGRTPKRTIVFTVSVHQAEMLCNIFNRAIPGIALWVCGKTSDSERSQIFQDFQNGKSSILVNVGVTTEGYDNPYVELIAMARPTKSQSLYAQCVGRATRTLPGLVDGIDNKADRLDAIASSKKPKALVLDFVGNSGKHKLISLGNVLGGNVSDEAVELAVRKAREKRSPISMTQAMLEAEEELKKKVLEARMRVEARKNSLVAKVRYSTTRIDPFSALDIVPVRERGWDSGKTLSEKQRALLLKQGLSPDEMSYSQGRQVLNEMFRRWGSKLATLKQCNIIKKNRPQIDCRNLTMDDASKIIGEIFNKN